MNTSNLPLNVKLNNCKKMLDNCITSIIMEYGLPAFLIEGILSEVLLDVKKQSSAELIRSYNEMLETSDKDKKGSEE